MGLRKRWGRKLSIPAAKAQSKRGWGEGIDDAHDFIQRFDSGEIAPLDVWESDRWPQSKAEVELFVNSLLDNMDLDRMARDRHDQGWNITDMRVYVFALGVELTRLLEARIGRARS